MKFENREVARRRLNPFRLTFQDRTYILVGMLVRGEDKRRLPDSERTVCSIYAGRDHSFLAAAKRDIYEAPDTSLPLITRVDAAELILVLQRLEVTARQRASRIALKARGKTLFLDLAEVMAVQAEGNYVSLLRHPNCYLLRESLSSMAEKLEPYGFVRIHRSVIVNISAVEEIEPLQTGEYGLRLRCGKEYLVTRTYKHKLRDLAQLWVGSERLPG